MAKQARTIRVENLQKRYGGFIALDGVSFEVNKGETFGLLGPNGAGKTTTIQSPCGLLKPDEGSIRLAGRSDPTLAEVRPTLGVVPQTFASWRHFTLLGMLGPCLILPAITRR